MSLQKNLSSFLTILLTSNCFAQDATHLNKNDRAPYEGIIVTMPKAQELHVMVLENKEYKLLNSSLQSTFEAQNAISLVQQEKVNLVLKQNDDLAKSLESARNTSEFTKFLYFSLGIFATGLCFYGVQKISTK